MESIIEHFDKKECREYLLELGGTGITVTCVCFIVFFVGYKIAKVLAGIV